MAGITASFGFPYASQFLLPGHHNCCESNSGQLTPHSPHTPRVCSYQLEQVLQAQQKMSAVPLGLLPRVTPNFPAEPNLIFGPRDSSTVAYSPLLRQTCDVKDLNTGALNSAWFVNPARYADHQNGFDRSYLACHAYGDRFSPVDLNSGARRKNATRETTSTLKAWLYEHRKNPYPTKGEKIMLAILTKMTLTQVSTWFANARRRLKKENKMTWSPRNRCGERKDSEGYSDDDDEDDEGMESKTDDVIKSEEKDSFRMTTVIKSAEDAPNIHHPSPAPNIHHPSPAPNIHHPSPAPNIHHPSPAPTTTQISSTTESYSHEPEVQFPNPAEQRIIWPTGRYPVETDNSRLQHTSSIEDSPVKSLRKWVDGCFDNTTNTAQAPDTPPQTPPCETDRLTERLTQSMEQETRRQSRSPSPCPPREEKSYIDKTQDRSHEAQNDGTTNREIDAALALTTLFGSRS